LRLQNFSLAVALRNAYTKVKITVKVQYKQTSNLEKILIFTEKKKNAEECQCILKKTLRRISESTAIFTF
jgi:hypothetical protein